MNIVTTVNELESAMEAWPQGVQYAFMQGTLVWFVFSLVAIIVVSKYLSARNERREMAKIEALVAKVEERYLRSR